MHDVSMLNTTESENSNATIDKSRHNKNESTEESVENARNEPDSPAKQKLRSWLNKNLKIEMTDGRVLIGVFLCTDRDGNVILGSCCEYLKLDGAGAAEEPRVLGLVMVPGRHIVSVFLDDTTSTSSDAQ
ncbi:N-alpha-acetyltransferase 38-A, NatC auxiliary subunit isoform X2 [Bacillus rossius redtenbacheri]|uniref:N-alpha-acetyltransferase 38-A, NatC auxiliary subunit isoform X2 n=1 Tax=Bacillus rossius redtenbacheri TaxID=93214 RepID=UPI002FDD1DC5